MSALQPEQSKQALQAGYAEGVGQIVTVRLPADLETTVAAFLKIARDEPYAFLLESVEGGAARGRYSMIGLKPDVLWRCEGGNSFVNTDALHDLERFSPQDQPPITSLRELLAHSRLNIPMDAPPMSAGVFGYLGYDMVRLMEHLPDENNDALELPDALLIRPTIMVIFDSVKDEVIVSAPLRFVQNISFESAYSEALQRIADVLQRLRAPHPTLAKTTHNKLPIVPVSNTAPQEFHSMVGAAKEYIRAGDIFQVVLSQRFEAPFPYPAFALYRSLRRVNPAPFLVYLQFPKFSLVSSSPEILVRLREGKVTIRPIAGTRPRGKTHDEDIALEQDLLADPKERAEHLMLLDLGRNDVGRVSQIGTVRPTAQFTIERYARVMHIVSNVEGEIAPQYDALDALMAGFPAGTVSGAPKVRAMEIIDELERDKRGPYAGCVGYFGANGDMDTCIVLRTAVVKDGVMSVQAGAGIVYDSDPQSEQQECINKASALFMATELAGQFV